MNKTKGGAMLNPIETKSITCNGNLNQFIPSLQRVCESIDIPFYDETDAENPEYRSFWLMSSIDPLGRIEVRNRPDKRISIIYTRYKREYILSDFEVADNALRSITGEELHKPPDCDSLWNNFHDALFSELENMGFECFSDDSPKPKITGFLGLDSKK
jgi:hypothetical protein